MELSNFIKEKPTFMVGKMSFDSKYQAEVYLANLPWREFLALMYPAKNPETSHTWILKITRKSYDSRYREYDIYDDVYHITGSLNDIAAFLDRNPKLHRSEVQVKPYKAPYLIAINDTRTIKDLQKQPA